MGRGRTRSIVACLAVVIWPLTTHPFRDGSPFLLVNGDAANIWAHIAFLFPYVLRRNILLVLSRSCSAACGHHLSPRTAIVFSLPSTVVYQAVGGGGKECTHTILGRSPTPLHRRIPAMPGRSTSVFPQTKQRGEGDCDVKWRTTINTPETSHLGGSVD